MKRPLVILTGPTAVGKTALSIQLAKAINAEIISADSMQVYKEMNIGTAKIRPDEMDGVAHYLIDAYTPDEEFNVVEFQRKAKLYIEDIYSRGRIPLIVGGTGFYIQAVLYNIDFTENDSDTAYRRQLETVAEQQGHPVLHGMLRKIDPVSADAIHENNVKRVIRALEFFEKTGKTISKHNEEQKQNESPYNFEYFVLNHHRELLYERINQRIDEMLKEGLVREVQELLDKGYDTGLVSMQGLGYKEIAAYLKGECTLDEAVYILKRDTRHFAKRQLTWFKREKMVRWIKKNEFNNEAEILAHMKDVLKSKGIIE